MEDLSRGVRSFTIGTAVSRILGLVREAVFAHLFGAASSPAADAFNVAFRIPNLLRDLFAETALSAAFVPVLTAEKVKSKAAENRLASNMFNILFLVTGAVSLAGVFLSPFLVKFIAFGFGSVPGKMALTSRLTAVLFPFLLFVTLGAWAMSYLNTEKSFFIPSVAPAMFNVFSIIIPVGMFGWYTARGGNPIFGMAWGVLAGGLMQFLIQVPLLRRHGFRHSFVINFRDPEFKRVMILFVPVAIGLAGSRINVLVNTILVTPLAQGSVSWLNYAFRIMHLPLGLFGMAVGTVALPTLSKMVLDNDRAGIRSTMFDSLKMVLFLTVPTSALIAFLAVPITRVIYQHGGRFTAADTAATAAALVLYTLGIPFMSSLRNLAAVFYAHKDARTPMLASFASIGLNLVLNLSLMWVLGYRAFPLSATLGAMLNVTVLMIAIRKKTGDIDWAPMARFFALIAAASAAGGGAAWFLNGAMAARLGTRLPASILSLGVAGTAGLVVFFGAAKLLGLKEAGDYMRRFMRRAPARSGNGEPPIGPVNGD